MDAVANLAVDVLNQKEILPAMADIRESMSHNYQPTMSSSYDEGNSSSNSSSESNEEKGGKQLQPYDKKDDSDDKKSKKRKRAPKTTPETTEARRESHKIIEQKRRQKINEKINELRELLNYPDGTQNKAVVLQAAVDNIRNLKVLCAKLLASHRQLQEDYVQVVHENERLKKIIPPTLRPPGTAPSMPSPIANFPSSMSKPNANAVPNQSQPSSQTSSLFNELRTGTNPQDWSFVYDENQTPSSAQLIQQYQQAMAQRGGNPSMFQNQPGNPNVQMPNPNQSSMQTLSQPQGGFSLFSPSSTGTGGNTNLGYNSIEALARTLFAEGSLGATLPLPISTQQGAHQQAQSSGSGPEGNMQANDQFEGH